MLGVDRDGAFADLMCVPAVAVYPLPAHLAWAEAAMAEPVAAALGVLRAPIVGRGAVHGRGRIAELLVRVLTAAGHSPISWHPDLHDLDWIVEAQATDASLAEAMGALRPGGTMVLKSRPPRSVPVDIACAVRREITLVARSYGSFDDAVAWLASGRVAVHDLVGEAFPLDRFEDAFKAARTSERHKLFFSLIS
jgi:threonine dehydrogenase-like Zn-dependent dehydrogenase